MHVSHVINSKEVKKYVEENFGFLLTNKKGGFFSLSPKKNFTKYNGAYFASRNFDIIKTIESIQPEGFEPIEIKNWLSYIEKTNYVSNERLFMDHSNTILYEIENFSGNISLVLDCRKIYDFDDSGRIYETFWVGNTLVFEYTKYTDGSLSKVDYRIFLAVCGVEEYHDVGSWVARTYDYDNKREQSYKEIFAYDAIKIPVKNNRACLTFGFSENKEEAIRLAEKAFKNYNYYVKVIKNYNKVNYRHQILDDELDFAFCCSRKSLDMLMTVMDETEGILAGLPWFYQFWTRDEAVSTGALIKEGNFNEAKRILLRHLDGIERDGRIKNRFPDSELASADGVGWIFKRLHDLFNCLVEENILEYHLSKKDLSHIKERLRFCIKQLFNEHTKDGLSYNEEKETWMDTDYEGDTRAGYRIEIQALRLSMYNFMYKLCELNDKKEKKELYGELEEVTAQKVRELFFHDYLYDGVDDPTVRPNVFLAYYIYPQLLSKRDWKKTFDKAIEKLWLDWGGFASIQKDSPIFFADYTGEDNRSYHRGDSWYFVNNIAAICLNRIDRKAYSYYIDKISRASSKDILYKGFIGHGSEISSASVQKGEGSLSQAWSVATFIELYKELKKNKRM